MAKRKGPPFPNLRNYPCNLHPAGLAIWVLQKVQLVGKEGHETTNDTPLPRTSRTRRSSTASAAEAARLDSQRARKAKQRAENWVKNKENDIVARARLDAKKYLTDDATEAERQNWVEQRITEDYDRLLDFNAIHINPLVRDYDPFKYGYADAYAANFEGDVAEAVRLLLDVLPALTSSSPTVRSCDAATAIVKALKDDKPPHDAMVDGMRILANHQEVWFAVDKVVGYLFSPKPSMPSLVRNPTSNQSTFPAGGLQDNFRAATPTGSGFTWQTPTTPANATGMSRASRIKHEYQNEDSKIDPSLLDQHRPLVNYDDDSDVDDTGMHQDTFMEDYNESAQYGESPGEDADQVLYTGSTTLLADSDSSDYDDSRSKRRRRSSAVTVIKQEHSSADNRKTRSSSRISAMNQAVNYVDAFLDEEDDLSYDQTPIRNSRRSRKPTEKAKALAGTKFYPEKPAEVVHESLHATDLNELPLASFLLQDVNISASSDIAVNPNTRDRFEYPRTEVTEEVDHGFQIEEFQNEQTHFPSFNQESDNPLSEAGISPLRTSTREKKPTPKAMAGTDEEKPARKRATSETESKRPKKDPKLDQPKSRTRKSSTTGAESVSREAESGSSNKAASTYKALQQVKQFRDAVRKGEKPSFPNSVKAPSKLRQSMSSTDVEITRQEGSYDDKVAAAQTVMAKTGGPASASTFTHSELAPTQTEDTDMPDAVNEEVQVAATLAGMAFGTEKDVKNKCDWCTGRDHSKGYTIIKEVMGWPDPDSDSGEDFDYEGAQAKSKAEHCTCHMLKNAGETADDSTTGEAETHTEDFAEAGKFDNTIGTSALEQLAALPVGTIRKSEGPDSLQSLVRRAQSESQESDIGNAGGETDDNVEAPKTTAPERVRSARRPKRASTAVPSGTRGSLRASRAARELGDAKARAGDEYMGNALLTELQQQRLHALRREATQRGIAYDERTTIKQLDQLLTVHAQAFQAAQMQFMQQQYVPQYMPGPQFGMPSQPMHGMSPVGQMQQPMTSMNQMQQPIMGHMYQQGQIQQMPNQFYRPPMIDLTQSPPGEKEPYTPTRTTARPSSRGRGERGASHHDRESSRLSRDFPSTTRSRAISQAGETPAASTEVMEGETGIVEEGRVEGSVEQAKDNSISVVEQEANDSVAEGQADNTQMEEVEEAGKD